MKKMVQYDQWRPGIVRTQSGRVLPRQRSWICVVAAMYFMSLAVGWAQSSTYYVAVAGNDSSPGSLQQPFRTIRRALRALRAGDTLQIRGGTYTEPLMEIDFGASGTSWSAPITVTAYPGEAVTLRVVPGGDNVVRFQDGSIGYVSLDGITIDGTGGGSNSTVVYLGASSHHLRFRNVEIKNSQQTAVLGGGRNHEFINLNVHDNGVSNTYFNSNGMYLTTDDSIVLGGQFYDNECAGIRVFDSSSSASADGNVVRGVRAFRNGAGRAFNGSSQCASDGAGIVLSDLNNVAYNNLIYENRWGVMIFTGGKTARSAKVYHNTIYSNSWGVQILAGSVSTELRNNIIYGNGNTVYDNASGTLASNNVTANPMFVNAGAKDFNLVSGSPAIDSGMTLALVSDDLLGKPRPSGMAYDAGALEYQSTVAPTSEQGRPKAPRNPRIKG